MKTNLLLLALSALASAQTQKKPLQSTFGRYEARSIYTAASSFDRPAVILLPGSGPNGPEEFVPESSTADGKPAYLFNDMAAAINKADVATFQIGKPGIDYLSAKPYNASMYANSTWDDLMNNAEDAIQFLVNKGYKSTNIHLLGHSEGTVVAYDIAAKYKNKIAGIILLGYVGETLHKVLLWQLFDAAILELIKPTVDLNHDGQITREEYAKWNDTGLINFKPDQESISIAEIKNAHKNDPKSLEVLKGMENSPIWRKVFDRKPIYHQTATLSRYLKVKCFQGDLDMQTVVKNALELKKYCKKVAKHYNQKTKLCDVSIIKGVGHGFSVPKPPRSHPYADLTLGPIIPSFLNELTKYSKTLQM
ncbi:hypothetical protein HK099_006993 [Clydaea vesicula]|uniref:Serine aminopeptidase S33 domain-containing protein n=1 Tax=Clydaea vesicula TaxID=447962 RepID=A0AAD5TXS8_9FUNG|nr:hypothetical protein HK099_006993 [Clydaea vesicula]KAJ3377913.1 hypothetical protein HDU92_007882 [Lobulomyces angularis]